MNITTNKKIIKQHTQEYLVRTPKQIAPQKGKTTKFEWAQGANTRLSSRQNTRKWCGEMADISATRWIPVNHCTMSGFDGFGINHFYISI
jgi:hypothetical protein